MRECSVTVSHGGSYNVSVGVTQRVQCNHGYTLDGSGLLRCTESGVESGYGACVKTGECCNRCLHSAVWVDITLSFSF